MTQCKICGSHAFNLRAEGIDQGELCDRHYYQDALAAKTADFDRRCKDFDEHDAELKRIIAGLRSEVAQAKSSERERCAKVCENFTGCYEKGKDMEACAEAIRALGDE